MKPEWIPIALILGFLVFQFVLRFWYPVVVFIHELGHAIPARCFGKKNVQVHIGVVKDSATALTFRLFDISFRIHGTQRQTGHTTYNGSPESVIQAILIILTAPLLSLVLTVALGAVIYTLAPSLHFAWILLLSALWLANFHITFSAWWPVANRHSDLLDFLKTVSPLCSRKNN